MFNESYKNISIQSILEQPFLNLPITLETHKTLIGANYFSGGQVIRFRINLNEYNEVFTNQIEGFNNALKNLVPSLIEHHCSVGERGGFFIRMDEGTLLGHVMEHLTIELQNLAGMNVGFGKTRETKERGVYNVVVRFFDEYAGIYAGKMAVHIINSILTKQDVQLTPIIENLILIREKRMLGFSTQQIVNEAVARRIPYQRLDKYNFVQLGTGCYRKVIRATLTQNTSYLAVENTDDKYLTYKMLEEMGIPVPIRISTKKVQEALFFYKQIQKPVVVKPSNGYRGKRVNVHLDSEEKIIKAFFWAQSFDENVIVQEFVPGNTYRILTINGKYVAAVQLIAPFVVGDGQKTIKELIDELNANPEREFGDKGKLSKVMIDDDTLKIIDIKGYTLQTVLDNGKRLFLKNSGNMRLGGTSIDVTEKVHPYNRFVCERISKLLNLDVMGVDIISDDISQSLHHNQGRVIEINAAPDFRMHIKPTIGNSQPVHKLFVDMLFPENSPNKIPHISITGSKGKTLLCKMLNTIFLQKGHVVGCIDSTGIYINGQLLRPIDSTDSNNTTIIFKDPTVTFAITETPVESILEYGIGYRWATIGIFLNIEEQEIYYTYDHIRNLEDVAYAKSVVLEEIEPEGTAILNADEPLIMAAQERIDAKMVYFSLHPESRTTRQLLDQRKTVAVYEDDRIVIYAERERFTALFFDEIPHIKQNEKYIKEVLTAFCLCLYVNGFNEIDIRQAARSIPANLFE
ncbi:MAG: cyanophycin synthetase family protein [Bacteroidales bacterium]